MCSSRLITIFLLIPLFTFSQTDYVISEPIDLYEGGWNKVLQMKNGNTMLFHFENKKGIIVKVFDETHKEIASKKHITKVLDLNVLDRTYFDGLKEINNEAVLFVTQEVDNRETMLRLRFNSKSGSLAEEEKLVKSPSFNKRILTHLLMENGADEYTVVCFYRKSATEAEGNFKIIKYNSNHEVIKEIPVETDNSSYDYFELTGCTIDRLGGVLVSTTLSKIIQYPNILKKHITFYYLPSGSVELQKKTVELPDGMQDITTSFTYNPFAKRLNILMRERWKGTVQTGLAKREASLFQYTMIIGEDNLTSVVGVPLVNKKLNEYLRSHTDTSHSFNGYVLAMNTNDFGLTSVVYQQRCQYTMFTKDDKDITSYIGVSQYDDDGKELWATVLPKSDLGLVHGDFPEVMHKTAELEMQLSHCIFGKKEVHILFNETDKNFNADLNAASDSIFRYETNAYNYDISNAMYYTIDAKRNIAKKYMFGNPVEGEYKHIYPMSGDYNKENNVYAVMVLQHKDKKNSMHLAWKTL